MSEQMPPLAFTVDLNPGEKLTLPPAIVAGIGPGRWLVTVRPWRATDTLPVGRHDAFLNGYAPEDEGVYDDLAR